MKCIKCGRPVGVGRYCNACGFDNKHIAKALNTADYYYNIGLEKAQMHDLSGTEIPYIMSDALDHDIVCRGGGGDFPRNVMCSPLSGVDPDEYFDVRPYAECASCWHARKREQRTAAVCPCSSTTSVTAV